MSTSLTLALNSASSARDSAAAAFSEHSLSAKKNKKTNERTRALHLGLQARHQRLSLASLLLHALLLLLDAADGVLHNKLHVSNRVSRRH